MCSYAAKAQGRAWFVAEGSWHRPAALLEVINVGLADDLHNKPKGWQIWVTLEQQRSVFQSAVPEVIPSSHPAASPQELQLSIVAPTHCSRGIPCVLWEPGSSTPLDIAGIFMLCLTDTICFLFSFPRTSPLLWERRAKTPFYTWGHSY